ncbi:MAG: cytochrome C oxidase subunit IV family protein [Acidobacteria bacterium]|nr:cytochrome C oxidase subunit IV family protein [Acidobacteriota bacterium]
MGESVEDIKKHVRVYIGVFVALLVLTGVTIGVSYIDMGHGVNIAVAIVIAAIKASLVAAYFMHLISEKKLIYYTLILAAIFFVGLMFLPVGHSLDEIRI